ncbi:MAG TPA: DNA-processing protein DprA [Woeseiaceae bacterium]|nr:DNA-processing protein DprA [Woeseiaceae bacterium]
MSDEQRAWLILSQARMTGAALDQLLETFGSAAAAVRQAPDTLTRCGCPAAAARAIAAPDEARLAAALEWQGRADNHLVAANGEDYPELLRQTRDYPAVLFVKGNLGALHLPSLAMVGSRNPTRGGIQNAFEFARHLGAAGFCIVSGLAQGIDSAAHRGALRAAAQTIAVLGHGIDRVYPAGNRELAHQVAAGGALVSEYPLGSPPRRENFPQRNRLISGLSLGTLVVEAAWRSGSLITARLASEQGREVFAIPGSIHNPLARGCHRLIREGAKLVESAPDILDELAPLVGHLMQHNESPPADEIDVKQRDADYDLLLDTLGHDPASADELAEKCTLTIDQVSSMLLILELEGEVEVLQGGQYSRLNTQ